MHPAAMPGEQIVVSEAASPSTPGARVGGPPSRAPRPTNCGAQICPRARSRRCAWSASRSHTMTSSTKVKGSVLYAGRLGTAWHAVRTRRPGHGVVRPDRLDPHREGAGPSRCRGRPHRRGRSLEPARREGRGGLGELRVAMPVLAHDRVRYAGEPIALVAAETQQIADDAAELVQVEYEELPGVFDPEAALLPGAPLVHDDGNVLISWHIQRGDVQAALAAADVVIEGEYRTQHAEHASLETRGPGWAGSRTTWSHCASRLRSSST